MEEQVLDQKGSSYFLLLCTVRGIVEKHGGTMEIDEKNSSFVLGIPRTRKNECFQELEQVIGPGKPLDGFSPFFAVESRP